MPVQQRVVLEDAVWRARAAAHEARVDVLVGDHLARRRDGVKHPVHDFLFTYYLFRPAQPRRWSPGYGVVCLRMCHEEFLGTPPERPDEVTQDDVAAKRPVIGSIHRLLSATAGRAANFGCFGMHEWAMVYGLTRCGTRPTRSASARPEPTPSSSHTGSPARTSTRSASSPRRPGR